MKTYHNNPALKAEFVARMQAHIDADEVIQGTGYENGRGCAVGCTYDKYDHELGPLRLGFPEWYEHLRDAIFEGLPADEAPAWALRSLTMVPVGVDLDAVRYAADLGIHRRALARLAGNNGPHAADCRAAIQRVIGWIEAGAESAGRGALEGAAWRATWRTSKSAAQAEWRAIRDDLIAAVEGLHP